METTDNFMQRLRGFMLFYAAYMQVDHAQHPHGRAVQVEPIKPMLKAPKTKPMKL
jgi:hypothetical protein